MYKIKVNSKYVFDISSTGAAIKINDQPAELDIQTLIEDQSLHILYGNKSFRVEIVEVNQEEKTQTIKVNGNTYTVAIEDKYDILLKQLGMEQAASSKVQDVKAPMPGLVLKVIVEEGQAVTKGDSLIILEAMKMENILKSTRDGIVGKILVAKGDKMEKNAVLIQFQ
jgi:biotin carboxyl carrier protein